MPGSPTRTSPTSSRPATRRESATSGSRSGLEINPPLRIDGHLPITASPEPRMAFLRNIYLAIKSLTSPETLTGLTQSMGSGFYVLLFAIIFAETGLVAVPFLPGDSLLFAVGAVSAAPDATINLPFTAALLIFAAVLGDAVNYAIGYRLGPK